MTTHRSKPKYTPGDWSSTADEVTIISRNGDEQYLIGVAHWGGHSCPIDCQVISREEAEANSTLMATAPRLLAALRTVVEMEYDRDQESRNFEDERLEQFAALIAEAEGRPG